MQNNKIKPTKLNTNIVFCEEITKLDLSKIKHKLLLDRSLNWDKTKIDTVEREYKRFLSIIKLYPNEIIVPNKLVDEFWHMHILSKKTVVEKVLAVIHQQRVSQVGWPKPRTKKIIS